VTTFRELGDALGCNPGTALRWHRKGMPLEVEAAKAWRAQHARARVKPGTAAEPNSAEGGSFSDWRTRRERAAALQAELDLAEQRGRLIDVQELRQLLGRHFAAARDIAMGMGARLAPVLAAETDPARVGQLLNDEVHRMLTAIADADGDLATRERGAHAQA
jgi:hypothetical protein